PLRGRPDRREEARCADDPAGRGRPHPQEEGRPLMCPMYTPDAVLDTMPARVAEATRITVCSDQPANFAGIAAVALADAAVTPGNGNGDFTIVNGAVSGRALQV